MSLKKAFNSFLLVCLTINRLLPLDKIFIFIFIMYNAVIGRSKIGFYKKIIIIVSIFIPLISFLFNYPESNYQIFYPTLFLIGAILLSRPAISVQTIRKVVFVNIFIGLVASFLAFNGIENNLSFSLIEKNLPFLYAPYGFSPTQQVYGTFCIILLIISFEYKKFDILFFISLFSLLLTLNRSSLIFLLVILGVYKRKLFVFLSIIIGFCVVKYWGQLELILFSNATLISRTELRQGFDISFWSEGDYGVYLLGRGTPFVSSKIASQTLWERTYIESGIDFVLHCYGFLGLGLIVIIMSCFILYLIKLKQWRLAIVSVFYLFFEPLFTHEFLASSFFFFIGTILILSKDALENQFLQERKV